jgi:hypothetical protein
LKEAPAQPIEKVSDPVVAEKPVDSNPIKEST